MKYLSRLWVMLTSFFQMNPVHPHKQAMLNVIAYIKDNPSMWDQTLVPNPDLSQPTCFGGLLIREMGVSNYFTSIPMYRYLERRCAFSGSKTLKELETIVNDYNPKIHSHA